MHDSGFFGAEPDQRERVLVNKNWHIILIPDTTELYSS